MADPEFNLSKYYSLLKHATYYDISMAITDVYADNILIQQFGTGKPFESWFADLESKEITWQNQQTNQINYQLSPAEILNVTQIQLGAEESHRYWLCCLMTSSGHQQIDSVDESLMQTLADIAQYIGEDYNAALITNGLADELAARYEELNLLYGIDADFNAKEGDSTTQMYETIVEDCYDYMDVDIACLIMPEEHVLVVQNDDQIDKDELSTVLNKFQGPLYSLVSAAHEVLVVNKDEVADWTNPQLDIDYKYMAAPIFKSVGRMAGILVIANHENKKSFTNSDRKICEVLATEITKVTQSRHDALTGLLNRNGFEQKLQACIRQSYEQSRLSALLYIDIDQFKSVNELSGHNAGDILLSQLSTLLSEHIRDTDVLARVGGDDFAILLNNCQLTKALAIADKIHNQLAAFRFIFLDKIFDITASIGLAMFGEKEQSVDAVIGTAESACFTAKELGRNQVRLYEETDEIMTKRRDDVLWVSRIHNAIEEDRFKLYRQLITSIQSDNEHEKHYEILIRMIDEEGKVLSPFRFIPAAERYEQMTKLDRWVIKKTLTTLTAYDQQVGNHDLTVSINLSGQSLSEDGFADFIVNEVTHRQIAANRLCFEVTETAAIINLSHALKFMEKVRSIGCKFSLDDFGSGMSSFGYLKNLPVDYLKIDGHFVKTMLQDPVDRAMVESIHHIGHVMGLKTIAEFVEDLEMVEQLRTIGVDYVQGYALGKPEPFEV